MQKFISLLLSQPKSIEDFGLFLKTHNIALGLSGSFAIIFCTVLALSLPIPKYLQIVIILPAICIPFLLTFWFKWYLSAYAKKRVRDTITTRISLKKNNYLESIIQDSDDIIFTLDRDSLILKFNKGAEFHFGYSQEEVVGKPLSYLFVNEKKLNNIIKKTRDSGNSINEDISMKTKNREIRQLNLSISKMNYESINLSGFVVTAKDITEKKKLEKELKKKNEQLSKLAITDSLTTLYNVRHFYDQIKRELKRHYRTPDRKLSLILIDIDRFKELNDTEGHQMGDHVLNSLAEVMKVCIREDVDSAYRYGGDEFVIILPDTDKNQADVVARRIQKQFGAFKFGETSLSIGITEAEAIDNEETIVKRADDAMYTSKRSGKGSIIIT